MHRYFIKIPWWIRFVFPAYTWQIPNKEKKVYLTFDDGPHPVITPWVLEQLHLYGAKATFFCIGKNVLAYPLVFQHIVSEGHAVGNHTNYHLNGWKTSEQAYLADVKAASAIIATNLFRPPYGKIKKGQARGLRQAMGGQPSRLIMWDVLSADFDTTINEHACTNNVLKNVGSGSIVVFHDSDKAFKNLKVALPAVLEYLSKEAYKLEKIEI